MSIFRVISINQLSRELVQKEIKDIYFHIYADLSIVNLSYAPCGWRLRA